jgi:hypothetical protein
MLRTSQITSRRPAQAGISLLAILITLCAVAVAALVAIPAFFSQHDVTLDNACELLVKDLRSAQNRAAFLRTEAVFAFDTDGWRASDRSGGSLSRTAEPDEIERRFSRDGVFEGVELTRIDFGEDRSLVFDERGLALEAGEVEVSFRGQVRTVRVEESTGHAMVFEGGRGLDPDERLAAETPAEERGR